MILPALLTTQAAPLGSTAIRTAPPGIVSHAAPFQRWIVKPPGAACVPIAHSVPFAPIPTSLTLPGRVDHPGRVAGGGVDGAGAAATADEPAICPARASPRSEAASRAMTSVP